MDNHPSLQLPVDLLVVGPPCPPWAGQGCHKNLKDERANVFMEMIRWTVYFSTCGGFLMCIVENAKGIMHSYHGMESAADRFLRILHRCVPEFLWGINTRHLEDYRIPQPRMRNFIRASTDAARKRYLRRCLLLASGPCEVYSLQTCHTRPDQNSQCSSS